MFKLFVSFIFPINDPEAFEIVATDMSNDGIIELLETYTQSCIGAGADESEAVEREVYNILLQIDLSDDTITVQSNTGNKGLTLGILMDILTRMT